MPRRGQAWVLRAFRRKTLSKAPLERTNSCFRVGEKPKRSPRLEAGSCGVLRDAELFQGVVGPALGRGRAGCGVLRDAELFQGLLQRHVHLPAVVVASFGTPSCFR